MVFGPSQIYGHSCPHCPYQTSGQTEVIPGPILSCGERPGLSYVGELCASA